MSGKTNTFKVVAGDKSSKFLLGFVAVAVVGAGLFVLMSGGEEKQVQKSSLGKVPAGISSNVASGEVNEVYEQALREADRRRIEEAREKGDSAIPALIVTNTQEKKVEKISLEAPKPTVVKPEVANAGGQVDVAIPQIPQIAPVQVPEIKVAEVARPTIKPQQSSGAAQQQAQPAPVEPPPERDFDVTPKVNSQLKGHVLNKMQQLAAMMDNKVGTPSTSYFYEPQEPVAEPQGEMLNSNSVAVSDVSEVEVALQGDVEQGAESMEAYGISTPLPGNILYAQLISRANSDSPGPIVAEIVQGELAGAKVLGSFTQANDSLIIEFNSISIGKTLSGKEINKNFPISTVAVETKYIGTGLATSVDRHLFERVAVTFASSFLGRMGELLANQGTVTTVNADGETVTEIPEMTVEEAARASALSGVGEAGTVFNEVYGIRPTTVIVESGTPIGLLFLK